ncbi:CBS domain-containing protein CBSX5-like [Impatiens glandulifera]|uniref:CBS domain-containing protein CBSX5-like n=1 Tax=Impatiens glandulifera TaxID=253017 RepID=UPI001FB127CE|nr:CBS domain-containing protein CBSX5-like [Impatiens glandulifera]
MAVRFLAREVSDMCLGKPQLRPLPISASVSDALSALRTTGESSVSVWKCEHSSPKKTANLDSCRCVGKVCMVDIICFLCREDNLSSPSIALQAPISDLIGNNARLVKHLDPHSRLSEAIDCILDGAQNLIIPIDNKLSKSRNKQPTTTLHNGQEFCWLTLEDVVRFILNSIGVFSPVSAMSIDSLHIIDPHVMTIHYEEPASSALNYISRSLIEQKSVAVVDEHIRIIGEISPNTLGCCDKTVAAAISTLSAGDLTSYIDYGGPPEDLVRLVKVTLKEKKLEGMYLMMEEISTSSRTTATTSGCSSSSDDKIGLVRRNGGTGRYPQKMRRSEAIICHPWSSLVAVMVQALAHRMSHVWVVGEDHCLLGIVTFYGILHVFRNIARHKPEGETSFRL